MSLYMSLTPEKDLEYDTKKRIRRIVNVPESLGFPNIYLVFARTRLKSSIKIPETLIHIHGDEALLVSDPKLRVIKGQNLIITFLTLLSKKHGNKVKLTFKDEIHPVAVCTPEEALGLWNQTIPYKKIQRFVPSVTTNASVLRVIKHKDSRSCIFKIENKTDSLIVASNNECEITQIKHTMNHIQLICDQICKMLCLYTNRNSINHALEINFIKESREDWVFLNVKPCEWPPLIKQTRKINMIHRKSQSYAKKLPQIVEFDRKTKHSIEIKEKSLSFSKNKFASNNLQDSRQEEREEIQNKYVEPLRFRLARTHLNNVVERFDLMKSSIKHKNIQRQLEGTFYEENEFWDNFAFQLFKRCRENKYLKQHFSLGDARRVHNYGTALSQLFSNKPDFKINISLKNNHKPLNLTTRIFQEFVECFRKTADQFSISENDRLFMLEKIYSIKHLIISSS